MDDHNTAPSSTRTTTNSIDVAVQTIFEDNDFPLTLLSSTSKLNQPEEDEATDGSSCSLSSCFTSNENSNTCTRRNSVQSSDLSSGLATPLQFLFQSAPSSNLDSPTIPTSTQEANVLNGLDQLLRRITRYLCVYISMCAYELFL